MSRRTYTWNAYESTLTAPLLEGAQTTSVAAADGLTAPGYLVIDPDVPGRTEWIKVLSITGTTFDSMVRALAGSNGDPIDGIDHPVGAKVRTVSTKQVYDDIFDDIEEIEGDIGDIGDDLLDNYLRLDGTSPMVGPLALRSVLPTANYEASPKLYVDNAEIAAKAYADTLDNDQAQALIDHTDVASAHHSRYLDSEAVTANQGKYIPLNGSATATKLFVSGDVNLTTIRARVNDIHFENLAGADLFRWDDSVGQWEFKKNLNMESHFLISPGNPTNASHVGDRGFNDGRYATKSHTHAYLLLTGGEMTGDLILPAGTNQNTSLRFNGQGVNDGIYGDPDEISISLNGWRYLSVFDDSNPDFNVHIRGGSRVPLKIGRNSGALGTNSTMIRFAVTGLSELLLNYRAIKWLVDNHG